MFQGYNQFLNPICLAFLKLNSGTLNNGKIILILQLPLQGMLFVSLQKYHQTFKKKKQIMNELHQSGCYSFLKCSN